VSASSEVGDVADLPRAHGGGRGDAVPGGDGPARASRRVCRAGAGRPAACPKPRWRAFGADAPPPSSLEKRRERHKANASFFAFRARGGWRGRAFRCRGRARSWPSTVDAPFRFRASGEHVPYGLVLFLRVEGRGRHDVTDRAKRRDARPEFSRVRSDSLPAGQPSRVRWGPSAPPLQELRATGRGPSRERADAVRGRTLRRPRFPGRRCVGKSLSAKQVPRTDPYAPQSSNLHKGTFCRFSRLVNIPFGTHFWNLDVEEKRLERKERTPRCWVFVATLASAP
jgi:hypothetical protein